MKKYFEGFFGEFQTFIMNSRVTDMAIGVIMATTFKTIVETLIHEVIMPVVSLLVGGIDLSQLNIVLREAEYSPSGEMLKSPIYMNVGNLIMAIIDFVMVMFILFVFIKTINHAKEKIDDLKKDIKEIQETPAPQRQEELLSQILEAIKLQNRNASNDNTVNL